MRGMKGGINKNKRLVRSSFIMGIMVSLIGASFFVIANGRAATEGPTDKLNQQVDQKKQEIDALQQQIDSYKEKIKSTQQAISSIADQVALVGNQIAQTELDIQATEKKIEQTNLQIQILILEIGDKEHEIAGQKKQLAEYIGLIYQNDQVSYLEALLLNDSFSDFFNYLKTTEEIHGGIKDGLDTLRTAEQELTVQKASLEDEKKQTEQLKDDLTTKKSALDEQQSGQKILLLEARLTSQQQKSSLSQLQLEQQQVNADIVTLEKKIRQQLANNKKNDQFQSFGPARLSWPINPGRGISTYFHDPGYPFRYVYEHPGLDIRTAQGTPIRAPEEGYVARIQFRGDKSYAYIMLIHSDGLSTVFGHVSAVNVHQDQYVNKGDLIGQTGGLPGSIGSGSLTTGAHLHFEVRLNGIPVNPLEYLPSQ